MVRMIVVLAAGTALAGCAARTVPPVEVAPAVAEVAPVPVEPAPKPQIGTFGFDAPAWTRPSSRGTISTNSPTAPGPKTRRSPPTSRTGVRSPILQDLSQQRTRDLLDAAKDDPNSKIGTAYSSFLDEAAVEAKGLAPIEPWLNQIRGLKSRAGYAALSAKAARNGITGLFGGGVGQDDRNSDAYIVGLQQAGLGMPDRDMYLLNEPNLVSLAGGLSRPSGEDADARWGAQCGCPGQGHPRVRNQDRKGDHGPVKTARTRPRHTTR